MPSLRNNLVWTTIGNGTYALTQWGMLIVLARYGTPEMVGQFALALAITTPIMQLSSLQLRAVQATDATESFTFADYLGLRLITTSLAVTGLLIGMFVFGMYRQGMGVIVALTCAKGFESISDVVYGALQHKERLDRISLSLMVRGILSVGVFTGVLLMTSSLGWACGALALVWALVLLTCDLSRSFTGLESFRPRFSKTSLSALTWLALPLGGVMFLNALNANLPRYFLQASQGEFALGIYAAIAYLMFAGSVVVNALGQSVSPRLARAYASGDSDGFQGLITRMVRNILVVSSLGILVFWIAGKFILTTIYTAQYGEYTGILCGVALVSAIGYVSSILGYGITAARYFSVQAPTNFGETLVLLVGSSLFIPWFGLSGAVMAAFGGTTVHLGLKYLVLRHVMRQLRVSPPPQKLSVPDTPDAAVVPVRRKILHIFGCMNRGGAEMRTLDIMRTIDRTQFEFHFCTLSGRAGDLDEEIQTLGGTIHPLKLGLFFPSRFVHLVKAEGYDVVHSHVHFFSGFILLLAHLAGVEIRIAHFRSMSDGQVKTWMRRLRSRFLRHCIDYSATSILAVCRGAMDASWARWKNDARCQVVYNGIDIHPFETLEPPAMIRLELGLPEDCLVFIHVGRMDPEKNHVRLISIFAQIARRHPEARLVLVGRTTPDILSQVCRQIEGFDLTSRVVIAGLRQDVPRLLKAADMMIFPSVWEGLPGAVLEACAAGLPVLATDLPGVCEIAQEFPLVKPLSLTCTDKVWAEMADHYVNQHHLVGPAADSPDRFSHSPFTLSKCSQTLGLIWQGKTI